jgi:hypothetical protein
VLRVRINLMWLCLKIETFRTNVYLHFYFFMVIQHTLKIMKGNIEWLCISGRKP